MVVESELDALLLHQESGDLVGVVALASYEDLLLVGMKGRTEGARKRIASSPGAEREAWFPRVPSILILTASEYARGLLHGKIERRRQANEKRTRSEGSIVEVLGEGAGQKGGGGRAL